MSAADNLHHKNDNMVYAEDDNCTSTHCLLVSSDSNLNTWPEGSIPHCSESIPGMLVVWQSL
mgnify:CR=1 FL=1